MHELDIDFLSGKPVDCGLWYAYLTVIWGALKIVLGYFTGSLYIFLALRKSGGDLKRFCLGRLAAEIN